MFKRFSFSLRNSPHCIPVLLLFALCVLWWHRVLVGPDVLLPGEMLRGFAPFGSDYFGSDARAPWNILQWDGMAQYFPWRVFAARELQSGQIPLWNPHQFAGTPFVANSQSAVFYPLNFPFWTMDVARAFGVSAWLHSLLATIATYFLAQHWKLSRAASLLAAVAFGFAGYLSFWATLPTLSNCASWIPLLVLLLERATHKTSGARVVLFSVAIACALLAGHAQIFFYALLTLLLRAITLPRTDVLRALRVLVVAVCGALCLGAIQLLPTLELARLGHRAGQSASADGWDFVTRNALQVWSLPSLFVPNWPQLSFDENRGYVGIVAPILALCACGFAVSSRLRATSSTRSKTRSETNEATNGEATNGEATNGEITNGEKAPMNANGFRFALIITTFALLFATATPLAQAFYFQIPGLSQMGGVGRALILWNLGIALCAAFGLDFLRARWKNNIVAPLAIGIVTLELFAASWNTTPTAPRETIYPPTTLTTFLQNATRDGSRVLFLTPRKGWFASEDLREGSSRTHPAGVLPPNGATVYEINDINGYDSLSSGAYRQYLIRNEGADISPPRNGNIVLLNNLDSRALDELNVRFVVSQEEISRSDLTKTLTANGSIVYRRNTMNRVLDVSRKSGCEFFPGWTKSRDGVYNPQSFRLGVWISLCALLAFSFVVTAHFSRARR